MATVWWTGNGQLVAQVVTLQVTAAPAGGTLTATVNGKSVTYTCVTGDTTATAAAAWLARLSAPASPPEFKEVTWTVSGPTVTATASTPGTPFTLTSSAAAGAGVTQTTVTANSSPSDVNNPANWLRAGSPGLPQNGDDVILADSSVPLLWSLSSLSAVQFATFTRYQSFTGSVGLPENNPLGYYEYRPTYFQFTGPPAGTLAVTLGPGVTGGGPSRERYNVGGQRTALTLLASGGSQDDYAVRFLGTNANNTVTQTGSSLAVAMLPGEVSTIASATVDGRGSLALGSGVTFSGALLVTGGSADVACAPATLTARNGARVVVQGAGLTYPAVTAQNGSSVVWASSSTITTLLLETSSVLDKSGDARAMTIINSTLDGDTCSVLDPNSAITWTNACAVNGQVSSGPFTFTGSRTVKIT